MSFFDALFGRKLPKVDGPEHLRDLLMTAVESGDTKRFEGLCRAHRETIARSFDDWARVPAEVRSDAAAVQRYANGLISTARFFAESLNDPALLQRLIGRPEDNPLIRWREQIEQAQALMDELRYGDAIPVLTEALEGAQGLTGPGVDEYLPITHGRLGECYFHGGEAEKALPPTQEALALCEANGDLEGVRAYLGNLYEIHRYLGDGPTAATYAARLAEVLDAQSALDEARWFRKQARIVREGEPPSRVVAVLKGCRYELDEVPDVRDARVQLIFERNRATLRPALELTKKGEELGQKGEYERALAAFRSAALADPFDPHARYLEGLTLLNLKRAAEAVTAYEACETRAPGWFQCRTDLWLARGLAAGSLDNAAFIVLMALEDGREPPDKKVELARQAIRRFPKLAPLYLIYGKSLAALGRDDEAEAALREGLACAEEPDIETRLLAALGASVRSDDERRELLERAAARGGNLVSAAMARLILKA